MSIPISEANSFALARWEEATKIKMVIPRGASGWNPKSYCKVQISKGNESNPETKNRYNTQIIFLN
jgi:hypothetical protein